MPIRQQYTPAEIEELKKQGIAREIKGGYIIDLPGSKNKIVYKLVEVEDRPGNVKTAPPGAGYVVDFGTTKKVYIGTIYPSAASDYAAEQAIQREKDLGLLNKVETGLTIVLHVIPLGTLADYSVNGNGNWKEALLATAGDAAILLTGGGSKLIQIANATNKASKLRSIGIAMQVTGVAFSGGVLTVNIKVAAENAFNGDWDKATVNAVQAVIQVFVLRSGAKQLKLNLKSTDKVEGAIQNELQKIQIRSPKGTWSQPSEGVVKRAESIRKKYDIPGNMSQQRHHYLASEISDQELMALSEAEGREFAVVTYTIDGRTRRFLIAGGVRSL